MEGGRGDGGRLLTGYLLMVVTAVLWAGAWITARLAAHAAPAVTVSAGRFLVAGALLLPAWWLLGRKAVRLTGREWLTILGMSITGVAAYTILFMVGVSFAPASDGAIITPGLAGLFSVLLAWPIRGERPTARVAAGAFTSLIGVALVGWSALSHSGHDSNRVLGDLLFAGSALTWGTYTVLGRGLADRVPAVQTVLLSASLGAAILVPVALLHDGVPDLAEWPPEAWLNVIYLGAFATAIAFVTYYMGVRIIGLGRTMPALGLVPFFGVLGAAYFLKEELTPLHAVGGALVITGILLSGARRRTRRVAAQP